MENKQKYVTIAVVYSLVKRLTNKNAKKNRFKQRKIVFSLKTVRYVVSKTNLRFSPLFPIEQSEYSIYRIKHGKS